MLTNLRHSPGLVGCTVIQIVSYRATVTETVAVADFGIQLSCKSFAMKVAAVVKWQTQGT